MRKNFRVKTEYFSENSNCIMIGNYHFLNEVVSYPSNMETFKKDKNIIGVWKIKQLKI